MTKTKAGPIAADRLKSFVERYEKLDEEKRAIADDMRDVLSEAHGVGYDRGTIKWLVKERKLDAADRDERDALRDVYAHALGMAVSMVIHDGLSLREASSKSGVSKSSIHRALTVPAMSQGHEAAEAGQKASISRETLVERPAGGGEGTAVVTSGPGVSPASFATGSAHEGEEDERINDRLSGPSRREPIGTCSGDETAADGSARPDNRHGDDHGEVRRVPAPAAGGVEPGREAAGSLLADSGKRGGIFAGDRADTGHAVVAPLHCRQDGERADADGSAGEPPAGHTVATTELEVAGSVPPATELFAKNANKSAPTVEMGPVAEAQPERVGEPNSDDWDSTVDPIPAPLRRTA